MIKKAEKSLKKAPEGSLKVSKSNGCTQYYRRMEGSNKVTYIGADKKNLVRALAQKEYDQKFLKIANKEKYQISKFLGCLSSDDFSEVYNCIAESKRSLIEPYYLTDEQYIKQWESVEYVGKRFDEEMPVIISDRGERVRSKSEKILADKFYKMGIPYRYEFPLKLKGFGVVYPDFTLLNIVTRKEIYVEHFGMMDDPEYCKKAIDKIEQYERNGIYLGKNLIVTFETSKHPLNMKVFEEMLMDVLLRPF